MCRDWWGPSETYVFPYSTWKMYIFNIISQFRFYCPYLWIIWWREGDRCSRVCRAFYNRWLSTNSVAVDLSTFTDKFVSHRLGGHWRVAFESLSKTGMRSIPFPRRGHFIIGEVNKWGSMGRCLSSSSWYKQSHQYPTCQWWMNGHCRKTSNHELMIQLLLLRARCLSSGVIWDWGKVLRLFYQFCLFPCHLKTRGRLKKAQSTRGQGRACPPLSAMTLNLLSPSSWWYSYYYFS